MRRAAGPHGTVHEGFTVHPEFSGTVVADQPDAFESCGRTNGGPQQDRGASAQPGRDGLQARELAGRFDGDCPDAGSDRSSQLPVPLARPREHDVLWLDTRSLGQLELPARRHVGTEAKRAEVPHHGQRGIGLHGIREIERRWHDRPQSLDLTSNRVEVVHVERGPELLGECLRVRPSQAHRPFGTSRIGRRQPEHAHRRAASSATRASVPGSRSLTITAVDSDNPCSSANGPSIAREPGTTTLPGGTASGSS